MLQESPCTKKMSFNYYKTSVPLIKRKSASKKLWTFSSCILSLCLQLYKYLVSKIVFRNFIVTSPLWGLAEGSVCDRDLLPGTLGLGKPGESLGLQGWNCGL